MTLKRRIATSFLLVGLTVWILFKMSPFWFTLETLIFIALALYEFFTLLRRARVPVYRLFGVSLGIIIPLVVYLEQGATQSGEVLFLVLGCFFLFLLQFSHKNNSEALIGISLTLFGILYVSWFLSFLLKIRYLDGGVVWIAYLVTVTKMADVGAYFVGTAFGHHALIPHVSPKKSVEGFFGGVLASTLASAAIKPYLPLPFSWPHVLIIGFLIGVIGQIGDLSESLMKRFCGAKDSSSLLPGIGGFLDTVDSILFTAPIFYFHLKISP
jgi:phosphatidate cytidylyltransferase